MEALELAPQVPAEWMQGLLALRARLGPQTILFAEEVSQRHHNDWSLQPPVPPCAVARPATPVQLSQILQTCHALNIPVVPQGGLTGLSGGARPSLLSLALSMERMVGVEEIDTDNATMTVWAGTPLETIQKAAQAAGFVFALDMGSRGSCSIGGNLATNAGGNRVIRYGMARDLVLGMEVVLADGTVVSGLHKMVKNNAGYDLKHVFMGSEGTLGVITRAVLRLHPQPSCVCTALCALPDVPSAVALLRSARLGLGPLLSAFEVMWPDYWHVATREVGLRSPLCGEHGAYALIELEGTDANVDPVRFEAWLQSQLELGLITDATLAQSLSETQSLWALRDACGEFPSAIGAHIAYDVGLPIAQMAAFVSACKEDLRQNIAGCQSVFYGHIGDGNLHVDVWVPGLKEGYQPKEAMDRVVYAQVQKHHGSVSAEHGIGSMKLAWLPHSRSTEELELMRLFKQTLDPKGILNPGKVLPAQPRKEALG